MLNRVFDGIPQNIRTVLEQVVESHLWDLCEQVRGKEVRFETMAASAARLEAALFVADALGRDIRSGKAALDATQRSAGNPTETSTGG